MGVNVSKNRNGPVIRSKNSDNTMLVESCDTFSLNINDDQSPVSSTSSSSLGDTDVGKKSFEVVAIGNVKVVDTHQKHADVKPSLAYRAKNIDSNAQQRSDVKSEMSKQPVSDAEKRFYLYGEELRKSKKPQEKELSDTNALETKPPKPNQPTKTHILMKNDDILKVRRTGVFTADMLSDVTPKTLTPITSKKPGQTDILYELGQEGIVKPMSAEQKTLGELRTMGIIQQNNNGGGSSGNSFNKKVNPRLTPLKVEHMWSKVPEAELTAPWETKDIFQENASTSDNSQVKTENDTSWQDDGELQINESTKLKIKMMDVDLL